MTVKLQDVKITEPKVYSMQQFYILIFLGVWLLIVTGLLIRLLMLQNRFKEGVKEDLDKKGFAEVRKRLSILEEDGKLHIQKVGIVRFNPFKELGGDHSFSLAVLDGRETGIVITSLHTRDRTRVYIKSIKNGKSDSELSSEEVRALAKAK